ncbi:cytochrome P450 [Desarmillaria ectypa]|nr:cytochrome P450 [Desarmillaria ectypa]
MKDDVYKGYFIPGSATVIGNAWAILHDEKDYPNPLVFDPDRFMKKDGQQLPPDPTIAFGFGRRSVSFFEFEAHLVITLRAYVPDVIYRRKLLGFP